MRACPAIAMSDAVCTSVSDWYLLLAVLALFTVIMTRILLGEPE